MTTTVYHPTLPVSQDVDDVEAWTEQGWCETKPDHFISDTEVSEQASADKKGTK